MRSCKESIASKGTQIIVEALLEGQLSVNLMKETTMFNWVLPFEKIEEEFPEFISAITVMRNWRIYRYNVASMWDLEYKLRKYNSWYTSLGDWNCMEEVFF